MDFKTAIELIIKDLNDAYKIIDDFKNYQGVPELHIEFAKAKCKSSAEIIALLKKDKTMVAKPLPEEKKDSQKEILIIEETAITPVEEKKIFAKIAEKQPAEECVKEVAKTQPKPSSIIADSFTDMPTINERLGNREHKDDVTEIIKSKPISSLRNAIGLNDRFLLIREIFNGDKGKYEQTIAKLEEATSFEDAKTIISGYSNPDDENEAMGLLLDLVKRKLNLNE